MEINLIAGAEQIVDLGLMANRVRIVNLGDNFVYAKNNASVVVSDADNFIIPGNCTSVLEFGYDNCRYLHIFSSQSAKVTIDVVSTFQGIFRGTLVAGEVKTVDFGEQVRYYDVQNLSENDNIYFALDARVNIDGKQSIELLPGTGFSDNETITKLTLISSGTPRYQVKGRR